MVTGMDNNGVVRGNAPMTSMTSMRMAPELRERIHAVEPNRPIAAVIREALDEYLDRRGAPAT